MSYHYNPVWIFDQQEVSSDIKISHVLIEEIKSYYSQLNLLGQLDENCRTPNVFIIDKERNLRGRKGKNKK